MRNSSFGSLALTLPAHLARYFGISAEFWRKLQSAHELSVVAVSKRQELAHIIPHGQKAAGAALS